MYLYSFTRAAVTNTTDWVTNIPEIYFLIILEAKKSKIKVSLGLVSLEASPWLADGHLLLLVFSLDLFSLHMSVF